MPTPTASSDGWTTHRPHGHHAACLTFAARPNEQAERLQQQLAEERGKAATQGELWKQQMQSLRARARADKERIVALQSTLRGEAGGSVGLTSPALTGELGSTPNGRHRTPRDRSSFGSSVGGRTPGSVDTGAFGSTADGVKGLLHTVDSKVDRAFDRMEGVSKKLVGRLARPLSAPREKE